MAATQRVRKGTSRARQVSQTLLEETIKKATDPAIGDEETDVQWRTLGVILKTDCFDLHDGMGGFTVTQKAVQLIRKQLKKGDQPTVLKTLSLLEELMRSCPYFYRHIANNEFFHTLWAFVVTNSYKKGRTIYEMLQVNIHSNVIKSSAAVNDKVLVLVKAWAEELCRTFEGQSEPQVCFIRRWYEKQRKHVQFPAVPPSFRLWVCPMMNPIAGQERMPKIPGVTVSEKCSAAITLEEIENTSAAFLRLTYSAKSSKDFDNDTFKRLVERCRLLKSWLPILVLEMPDEEASRAFAVMAQLKQASSHFERKKNAKNEPRGGHGSGRDADRVILPTLNEIDGQVESLLARISNAASQSDNGDSLYAEARDRLEGVKKTLAKVIPTLATDEDLSRGFVISDTIERMRIRLQAKI